MSTSADSVLAVALAGQVGATRTLFAQVFDQVARRRADEDYIDFKLAAIGQASAAAAYAAAFASALERGWCVELVTHAIDAKVLAPQALKLVAPRFTPQDAAAAAFQPEGLHPRMMPWLNAATFTAGLLRGLRRVCEVRAGSARGSGFLVGPQTVLTNWHVVQALIDPVSGKAKPDSAAQLVCRFDFLDGGSGEDYVAVEDWLVDWSPMPLDQLDVTSAGHYTDMTAHRPHHLDFAVLRLHGAPGRARSWYALKEAAAVPVGAHEFLFVLQHPSQFAQCIGVTDEITLVVNGEVRHMAPTTAGSSGGLCLDKSGNLVALHRGKLSEADGTLKHNLAVAAREIAAVAAASDSVDAATDTVWRLSRGTLPVLGREKTSRQLGQMLTPQAAKPILIVRGPDLCGKSFTSQIIEDRLGFIAPWLVNFAAAELPLGAREFAAQILERAGVAAAKRQTLPSPDDGASTDIAWVRDHLFPAFRALVGEAALARDPAHGRLLWLVIDQLNKSSLPATGSRQFLDTLYQQIRTTPEIRVVLLGLDGALPAGDPATAAEEDLPNPALLDATALERYLACLLTDCRISPDRNEIVRLARLVLHSVRAQSGANDDLLVRLSQYLTGPLRRAAGEWTGKPGA